MKGKNDLNITKDTVKSESSSLAYALSFICYDSLQNRKCANTGSHRQIDR